LQLPKSEKGGIPSFVIKKDDSLSAIFIFAPEARELLLAEYLYLDRATAERDAGYVRMLAADHAAKYAQPAGCLYRRPYRSTRSLHPIAPRVNVE
jgi:hypothetical protein